MAAGYLALDLMNLEHRANWLERKTERRAWREEHDPFELNNDVFIDMFRLTADMVMDLVEELEPTLRRNRPTGISVEHQILTALAFYAKGCYQGVVGGQYDLALSQPSVSRCVKDVTNAINQHLLYRWVKFPMSPAQRANARRKFLDCAQPFEGAIGAIDCTYIQILAPQRHEEAYVNHHGNHTLNVQVICDPQYKILNVNARYPGARHDAYIWNNSAARRAMVRNYEHGERNTWLIGDDGYPLEPWLVTPLKHEVPGTPRFLYNEALCSARSVVERLFGVWKSEFRCLSAQRKMLYEPCMAGKIVNACAVLHNMRIAHRMDEIIVDPAENQVEIAAQANPAAVENAVLPRAIATRIQERFITRNFGRL